MKSSLHSPNYFLPFLLNQLRLPSPELDPVLDNNSPKQSQSQSHIATDGQSVSKSWCRAPSGAHDQIFVTVSQLRSCFLFLWDTLSDERTGLSFVYAAGPCQRSSSRVRVPWDSLSYFTVSDLRLPFSSPPTISRVTVEVFDPASTRVPNWVKFSQTIQSQSHIATDGQSVSQSVSQ
jgi:hypothetical protein